MFQTLIFFLLFFNIVFTSPFHFTKESLPPLHLHRGPQEYFELTQPLPYDHLTPSCTHPVIHHSFAHTINGPPFSVPYSPPSDSDCPSPWSHVVLNFRAKCKGDQYDRIAAIWLGGVELLRTSTAEPTESGIFWNVRKDVTRYSSLLAKRNLDITMMLENIVNDVYTGVYHVDVTLLFYNHDVVRVPFSISDNRQLHRKLGVRSANSMDMQDTYEPPADLIIPISDNGRHGFWFRIEKETDLHYRGIRIPKNTRRVVLELYVSFHGNDEFWYSNPPNEYIEMNNLTTGRGNGAYREVFLLIDGKFVGSEVPFPVIFTGGINPLFWEPIVGIGAFNLPSYDIDLSPFLGMLLDGKEHEFKIGVSNAISYWLVDANLHLWLDHDSKAVKAGNIEYYNPSLCVKRALNFKKLDGSFKIKVKRKSRFAGWVQTKEGVFSAIVRQDYKFKNLITFQNNGACKFLKQKVRARREVVVRNSLGIPISQSIVKRKYPLNLITSTLPGSKKNTYLLVTNVSHAFEEYVDGDFSRSIYNSQHSRGWMEVRDHSVISGEANTQQSFTYEDEFICYSRRVSASDGNLTSDASSYCC